MVSIVYVCVEMVMPVYEMCFCGKRFLVGILGLYPFFWEYGELCISVLEGKWVCYSTINCNLGISTGSYSTGLSHNIFLLGKFRRMLMCLLFCLIILRWALGDFFAIFTPVNIPLT